MAQTIGVLGIDIAKQVFHVVGMDDSGHVVLRKRIARSELLTFIANIPPLRIGMEACGSAHYWARCFREHGHDVRLIAPQFVKAYVKSPKNDARDAEAICEAVTRPTMRFVPIKRVEQQDLQALHRIRERLIKARTALVNEMRGLLNEYGIILPQGITKFRTLVVKKLEAEQAKLTPFSAAIGDVTQFKNGRQLAAWLGLVPREHSTGGKPRLLGISKRGDGYLRKLLVHGARATLRWVETKPDDKSRWLRALIARRGKNRAAVALANKNARIAWALLAHNQEYRVRTIV
jgi:transposase